MPWKECDGGKPWLARTWPWPDMIL